MSEDGYMSSVRELFEDSATEDCVPDETFGSGNASSVSVGFSTPVKRRAKVRVIAPWTNRVAAWFQGCGGSLDRRWWDERPKRFGFEYKLREILWTY